MTKKRLWILGAPDPEMELIEQLLRDAGEDIEYAMADGRRVHPGNAYRADPPATDPEVLYIVECGGSWVGRGTVVIDHHRPGDPGYGRSPEEFLPASSIGQVIAELARLGVSMKLLRGQSPDTGHPGQGGLMVQQWGTDEIGDVDLPLDALDGMWIRGYGHRDAYADGGEGWWVRAAGRWWSLSRTPTMTAAADHCLGAAYHGECPGVDPDELMEWRVRSRAAFQRRDPAELLRDVEATREALRAAPHVDVGGEFVADMRRETPWPELVEAATREGIGYVSGPLSAPDGRRKYTCSGTAEQVKAFMDVWAPAQRLVGVYGDPIRGFAGGYADKEV